MTCIWSPELIHLITKKARGKGILVKKKKGTNFLQLLIKEMLHFGSLVFFFCSFPTSEMESPVSFFSVSVRPWLSSFQSKCLAFKVESPHLSVPLSSTQEQITSGYRVQRAYLK
jgi:hypothetical protein